MMKQAYLAFLLRAFLLAIGLLPALALVHTAVAATLTNADRNDRTISIIKGAELRTETMKSSALIKDLCPDGCIVRIDGDPERDFILEGRERVTIENGLLYYDGEISSEAETEDSN